MPSLTDKKLTLALMDSYPLAIVGLAGFITGLHESAELILQENSIAQIAERLQYQPVDLLVTELNGQNETIAEGCKVLLNLCAALPSMQVIVYTRCRQREVLRSLVMQSNISMISRSDALPQVGAFFQRVMAGERVFSPLIGSFLAHSEQSKFNRLDRLTCSENDVLTSLLNGLSLGQIAACKNRSVKTISAQKCSAMRKLKVESDSELFSLREQLVQV
jgi:two-component system, NarL family, captular synthesis response regulator RcsB